MWFVGKGCSILDQYKEVACEGDLHGNLYVIRITTLTSAELAHIAMLSSFPVEGDDLPDTALITESSTSYAPIDTWHCRLGHLNTDDIMRMIRKGMVKGMEITGTHSPSSVCEPCLKGKQTRIKIQKKMETHADTVLGRIFSDVCDKLPTHSHQGYLYFVTWVNNKSRKVFIADMREKSEVIKHLHTFISQAKLEMGHLLKVLRSDGGGEYTAGEVQKFLSDKGVKHEMITADIP